MVFQLYVRPRPRTLYLISDENALVIRCPDSGTLGGDPTAVVEFFSNEEVDYAGLMKVNKGRGVGGALGLISVPCEATGAHETFLVLVSASVTFPPIIPPATSTLTISKVLGVEFHCLTSSAWDDNLPPAQPHYSSGYDDQGFPISDDVNNTYSGSGYQSSSTVSARSASLQTAPGAVILPHPCAGIKTYLSTGTFFYSTSGTWDLSKRLSVWDRFNDGQGAEEYEERPGLALDGFDDRFVWNTNILDPLLNFRQTLSEFDRHSLDASSFLIPVIQGFCNVVPLGGGPLGQTHLGLISRLGWKRAGTRYATRGISDEGDVANFVETETILANEEYCCSYVQVRGSVPLFWEQQGNQTFGQKVTITRSQIASQPAFDKHFLDLLSHYQSVHVLNLLGSGGTEAQLSVAYTSHVKTLSAALQEDEPDSDVPDIGMTSYDFHANVKNAPEGHGVVREDFDRRNRQIVAARERYGYSLIDLSKGTVVLRQAGVFRINCLDCLDRTNYVEDVLSALTLETVQAMGLVSTSSLSPSALNQAHRTLWADNGDNLSKIYSGTGALNSSVTRTGGRKTFASLLSDASKSVGRAIQASFGDEAKGASIDLLVGMSSGQKSVVVWNPVAQAVQRILAERIDEYSSPKDVSIFVGTWNLNGKPIGEVEPWLFPNGTPDADIYVMGFQELVPLNAQQILNTDPEARKRCDSVLAKALGRHGSFVSLRTEQLVGTSLHVYVRDSLLPAITKVEGATRKTGARGMAGNKGGVGIRLNVYDTSICLMSCHLAAGHKNVAERNADYKTISTQMTFQRGKPIDSHDVVIWAADFNYRIDLDNGLARDCAETDELETLWEADQLRLAMMRKEAFSGYAEGRITFRPTYKYDLGSTEYDTGEKQRIPAWTDRVLFKGKGLRQERYGRGELMTSDHRPVYAQFAMTAREVNEAKKAVIQEEATSMEHGKQQTLDGLTGHASKTNGTGVIPRARPVPPTADQITRKAAPPLPPPKRADSVNLIDMDADLSAAIPIPSRRPANGGNSTSGVAVARSPVISMNSVLLPPTRSGRSLPPPSPQPETLNPSPSSSLVDEDYVRIRLSSPPSTSVSKPALPQRTLPPALPSRSGTADTAKMTVSQATAAKSIPVSRSASASSMSNPDMVRSNSGRSHAQGNGTSGVSGRIEAFAASTVTAARRLPPPSRNGDSGLSSISTKSQATSSSSDTKFVPKASTLAILSAARASPPPPPPPGSASGSGTKVPPRPLQKPTISSTSVIAAARVPNSPPLTGQAEILAGAAELTSQPKKATPVEETDERPMTVAERMKLFEGGRG